MKITMVTVSRSAINAYEGAEERFRAFDPSLRLTIVDASGDLTLQEMEEMKRSIAEADLTWIDLMGASIDIQNAVNIAAGTAKGHIVPYGASSREHMRLGALGPMGGERMGKRSDAAETSSESMKPDRAGMKQPDKTEAKMPSMAAMKRMKNMAEQLGKVVPGKMRDMRNYSLMMKYFRHGTQVNYDNLLLLMLKEYGGVRGIKVREPELLRPLSFFHYRDQVFLTKIEDYEKTMGIADAPEEQERDAAILFFSATTYPVDTRRAVTSMAKRLEKDFDVYVFAFAESFGELKKDLEAALKHIGNRAALVMNGIPFRLGAGPMGGEADEALELLRKLDVPYLHPFFLTRKTEEEWLENPRGCSVGETMISVILPELDGSQEVMPVAAMCRDAGEDGRARMELDVIPDRLEHFARRAARIAALRRKPNEEKRIAILCYNYPPGEDNLFGGAFLDTFESVANMLRLLKESGYDTEALSAHDLMGHFSQGGMVNEGRYDSDTENWVKYSAAEYESSEEMDACWGEKPGTIMTEKGSFLIPGIRVGKVFIGLQPSRGRDAASDAGYHDKAVPPHHQYVAYYQWLEREFCADALIHVGTHGTVEFLKGKEIGMSSACYPDRLIGSMPHIYLYYCGNPAEAVIAKRRSHANLVSYMPPVFVEGGLYGELLELQTELEQYEHALTLNPQAAQEALSLLERHAEELGLPTEVHELESALQRYQGSLIPRGLHLFGRAYSDEEQAEYEKGLRRLYAGDRDMDQVLSLAKKAQCAEEESGLLRALRGGYSAARLGGDIYRNPEVLPSGYNLYQFDPRLIPSKTAMKRGKEICDGTLKLFMQSGSSAGKSRDVSMPGAEAGGRRPENASMPAAGATERESAYPESVAVILWGLETSRTQGETIGQILAYLGVELDPSSSTWNRVFRIIPPEELGRPRIDVTVNICGFFRDMFPDILEELCDVFDRVQELDESEDINFVKRHGRKLREQLLLEGYSESEASEYAKARIFGPREGEYGTSLTGLIETKEWEKEEALGFAFTASLRHVYSRKLHGKEIDGLYESNLRAVEIVSQLRSGHEYEITDLDHYYEFFGGLAKSVETVRGKKAQMYISDTTQGRNITETIDSAINRGLRTRVLNPKWSDALLEHRYHGGREIAQRFENVMGLAATTGAVEQRLFDDLELCYVKDEKMRERMAENNPHAYMKILEQMIEYAQRGYWNADEEQLDRIRRTYLELEGDIEERTNA